MTLADQSQTYSYRAIRTLYILLSALFGILEQWKSVGAGMIRYHIVCKWRATERYTYTLQTFLKRKDTHLMMPACQASPLYVLINKQVMVDHVWIWHLHSRRCITDFYIVTKTMCSPLYHSARRTYSFNEYAAAQRCNQYNRWFWIKYACKSYE